jgi:MraZ protein
VFMSQFQHTLDDKGRVFLPARFRERLSSGLVITRGMDRCLDVWPIAEFEKRVDEVAARPVESKQARRRQRMLLSGAHDDVPDSQGRIVIPAVLREYASLQRDLMVVGMRNKVEIWDRARWEQEQLEAEDDFADTDEAFELA